MKLVLILLSAVGLLGIAFIGMRIPQAKAVSVAGVPVVAHAKHGQNSFEFTGRINQTGAGVIGYGYLTHVAGLADKVLFNSSSTQDETTARFTYIAKGKIHFRYVNSNIITTVSLEKTAIYFNQSPHATFSSPSSFAGGQIIGRFQGRFQVILNVQTGKLGIQTGFADQRQRGAGVFSLGSHMFQFGKKGSYERVSTAGEGRRIQANPLTSKFFLSGNAVLSH